MRFMVIVKATADSEAGVMPDDGAARRDGQVQRGARQGRRDAGGRGPAPELARARACASRPTATTVIDGPFAETKELIAGFWIIQAQVDGGGGRVGQARARTPTGEESEIEIRQVFEAEDFGDELTPELREQEAARCARRSRSSAGA